MSIIIDNLPPVEQADLYHVRLPLQRPFRTSFGEEHHRDAVLLRLRTDNGEGWGEAPVGRYPRYTHESAETAWYLLTEYLLPELVSLQPEDHEEWIDQLPFIRGHAMARGSVLMALADLSAKQKDVPLGTFYGADRNEAYSGISIGLKDDVDQLLDRIASSLEQGYLRIKIKIEPGRDLNLLEAIRDRFPDIPLMADGNGGYTAEDLPLLEQVDHFDLMMLEQPFNPSELHVHADLQKRIDTPICLDESIETLADVKLAHREDSCRIVNIKQPRVGGPIHALELYDFCTRNELDVFCGGLLETGIGRAHNVALASLPAFELPGDLSASKRYFPEDIVEPEFTLTDRGTLKLPDQGAGICVSPRMDRIEDRSIRQTRFS